MVKICALLCLLGLAACSSGTVSSRPLNEPLNAIFAAVESAMSMGIQGYSENHREAYSRPFMVKQPDDAKKEGYRERGRAKVTVLGDMRPYTIETEVSIEHGKIRNNQGNINYTFDRYDQRLADKLLKDILARLHKELRERNIIDDFKPF